MSYKQRLELDWIGKDSEVFLEPRILIKNDEKSLGLDSGNMLIQGDNLLGLKALESNFKEKIKCIYIDPPYNTGNAFKHYDDGLEHSQWLSLMKPRIELLRSLLSEDGSLWISIDDDESHYLKVMCDEIFGRSNFVSNVIWEKKYSPQNDAKWLSDSHDHILIYAKNKEVWRPNLLPRTAEMNKRYKNYDNDPRGPWKSSDLSVKTYSEKTDYPITTPSGNVVNPPSGYCWRVSKSKFEEMVKDNRIWFGKDGSNVPSIKRFLTDVKQGTVCKTIWKRDEVGDNQEAKREVKKVNNKDVFSTPKPERLIERILKLATNEGDLVLDSFAGSGTTGAVAHKMNRRWIMVELGEHALTHILPRMTNIVNRKDDFGISKDYVWDNSGFSFYELAPSLLLKDDRGNWVINNQYNSIQLAEAVCKHEKFKFHPSSEVYWKQGYSSEKDFIFITTQFLTSEHLDRIESQMKKDESLLICAKSFRVKKEKYKNITLKKIPQMLLGRCEFGRNDYSLNVVEDEQIELEVNFDHQ